MNTLEWLPVFLPSLWLFAVYVSDAIAGGIGLVWIIGRVFYMNILNPFQDGDAALPSRRWRHSRCCWARWAPSCGGSCIPDRHCEERSDEAIHDCRTGNLDCFAEHVIGRAFARPVGSQ